MKNKFTFKSEATWMLILSSVGLVLGLLVTIVLWLWNLLNGQQFLKNY
ncbi:hypothetical protein BH24ACI1_BH24ACI1_18800 [soil metagenome]